MKCSDFYNQIKSVLVPTGFILNVHKCVANVYFGNGYQVMFHDHWNASGINSLTLLQDINGWRDSLDYVAAHYYVMENGEKCVSLSATPDRQFSNDVEKLHIKNGQVKIEGWAH